jgi:hypothetical protein
MPMMNDAAPGSGKKMWKVLAPLKGQGQNPKTYWSKVGIAYTNRDDSINLFLDLMPLNQDRTQLQLRDYYEPDRREQHREDGGGLAAGAGAGSTTGINFGAGAAAEAIRSHTATSGDVPF